MSAFLIGAATSAHQTEGNNVFSDCWAMEHMKHSSFIEPSGIAADHYHHFEEDIALLAEAGCNAYRFSVEWARIEPEEGRFSEEAAAHYRAVAEACRRHGLEPVVTLHHFSSPVWLIQKGGWESDETPALFARYARYISERLGKINYLSTINEANMGEGIARAVQAFSASLQVGVDAEAFRARASEAAKENREVFGTPSPAVFLGARTARGNEIIKQAHRMARAAVREVLQGCKVGLTLSLHDVQAQKGGEALAAEEWQSEFCDWLPAVEGDDFIGVQNYTRKVFGKDGELPPPEGAERTQMGYEFYPEALEHVVRRVWHEARLPVLVTENGVAAKDDARRCTFIERALKGVLRCKQELPVLGYLHWSLLDNFEWQKGFQMQFGLVSVDRDTMARTPKESLSVLGRINKEFI